jgi:hypothetical protein
MLERENIQSRGFRNVSQNGKVIGFQIPIRSSYYRGVYLSQLRPATVTVDGEKFEGDQITWTIGGKTYTQKEMANISKVQWPIYEAAILTIKKSGGLKLGLHEINVAYSYTTSYMRVATNWLSPSDFTRKISLAR